jgi:hypothetical protein
MGWPSCGESCSNTMRHEIVALPAPNGMIARIGRRATPLCAKPPTSIQQQANTPIAVLRRAPQILRGDRRLVRRLAHLLELRFEPALEHAVDAVEVDVDHRGDEQREQLRQQEPPTTATPSG